MNRNDRKSAVAILVVVLTILVGGTAWIMHGASFSSADRGEVIATVDGESIYLQDAVWRVDGLTTTHGGDAQSLGSEWQDRVLQSLVDDVVIRQEADRRGIAVTDQQIADDLLGLQEMFATLDEYQTWLGSQGIDQDELERRIRLQRLAVDVYEAVTSGVTVSTSDVRTYFQAHRTEYAGSDGSPASFLDVQDAIQQQLEKEEKDAVYAAWLDEQRGTVDVVVLDEDWWRSVGDEQQG